MLREHVDNRLLLSVGCARRRKIVYVRRLGVTTHSARIRARQRSTIISEPFRSAGERPGGATFQEATGSPGTIPYSLIFRYRVDRPIPMRRATTLMRPR